MKIIVIKCDSVLNKVILTFKIIITNHMFKNELYVKGFVKINMCYVSVHKDDFVDKKIYICKTCYKI